ncbi:MAG TPA: HlyD family efflux transporter periplasmic adaptor subunit [Patescibacteria group bacterium]|nr:HlyD family efflux transporter periplasmic adaptor subunit [Patescibacteria group bacterium]
MKKIIPFISSKIFISMAIVVLLIAGGAWWYFNNDSKNVQNTFAQQTATVAKGDLRLSVSGSGAIASANKSNVVSEVQGTITEVLISDGAQVKAGDLILKLDDFQAQLNVKQLENSISQTLLTQQYNKKSLEGIKTAAPIDGEVTGLQVSVGDDVSKNTTLLTITDKAKLKLSVPFNNKYRDQLKINQEVKVNVYDTALEVGTTVKGTITSLSKALYKTNDGTEVYNVEVVLNNPGTIKEGMIGNVEIDLSGVKLTSAESSTLSYYNNVVVKAATGGTVNKINAAEGQPVTKGTILIEFDNDDLVLEIETTVLKLEDYYSQLEAAKNELDKYNVYAPIDGILTLNDLKAGDVLKSGDIIGYTADYDHMQFEISIDELDISKIKVGQSTNVTVDALAETNTKPINGSVSKVSIEGTSTNGVTTYPVTIMIDKADNLKSGMNANAEILIEQRKDVLLVPIQAVSTRGGKSFVYVKKEAGATETGDKAAVNLNNSTADKASGTVQKNSRQNQYANGEMRAVEIGINNEEYIEVLSGVQEGEAVILPSTSASQTNTQNQRNLNGGGIGIPGMGGGVPSTGVRIRQ